MSQLSSINISLPEKLKVFVELEVQRGGYSSASEYVRELIRAAVRERAGQPSHDDPSAPPQPQSPAAREDAFWTAMRERTGRPSRPKL